MALKIIYTFFVGILVAVFVGVGIAAFYPEPERPETPTTLKIYKLPADPTADPEILARIQQEQEAFDIQLKAHQEKMHEYNKNVSIIALVFAVIVLILSLSFAGKLMVVADGLLLGGVITLLYSVIRVFDSGDDKLRFGIVAIGLLVALVLGYSKFIKEVGKKHVSSRVP